MSLPDFESLLQGAMGLDAASITSAMVERAVRGRMAFCGVPADAPGLYLDLARTSGEELQALIEAVVVPETWFFRDREVFAALAQTAGEAWAARPSRLLRLASLPCSTGEEPYSMAMALLDAGLPPAAFRIDAVDISHRALEQARRGVYGKNSFRSADLLFRDRHFREETAGWSLKESVREQVRFEPGNLVSANLLPGTEVYDIVFCRNVLIYFGPEAREKVISSLERLLVPQGLLFMGPSETSLLSPQRFTPARLPHAFAFRKGRSDSASSAIPPLPGQKPRKKAAPPQIPGPVPERVAKAAFQGARTVSPPPVPVSPASPDDDLSAATRLADEGRLAEAAVLCETHLHRHGPSVRVFYLLGLVRDAAGDHREAAGFYRKALYLDPRNGEVLTHLASLLAGQGQAEEARLMDERARRAMAGREGG